MHLHPTKDYHFESVTDFIGEVKMLTQLYHFLFHCYVYIYSKYAFWLFKSFTKKVKYVFLQKSNGRQHVSIFPQFLEVTFPPKYRNEKIYQCFFLQYVHCTVPKKFIAETVKGHRNARKAVFVSVTSYIFFLFDTLKLISASQNTNTTWSRIHELTISLGFSGYSLESSQTWGFRIQCLHDKTV